MFLILFHPCTHAPLQGDQTVWGDGMVASTHSSTTTLFKLNQTPLPCGFARHLLLPVPHPSTCVDTGSVCVRECMPFTFHWFCSSAIHNTTTEETPPPPPPSSLVPAVRPVGPLAFNKDFVARSCFDPLLMKSRVACSTDDRDYALHVANIRDAFLFMTCLLGTMYVLH